jgi:hypothetical protein
MATNTYVALGSVTVGTATSSITFNSFSSAYTDLALVITGTTDRSGVAIDDLGIRFNSDTASTYSYTQFYGDGSSSPGSDRAASTTSIKFASWFPGGIGASGYRGLAKIEIMNYSNSTTHKTILSRYSDLATSSQGLVGGSAGTWRNTAAITSITIVSTTSSNLQSGFTASLYGIKKWAVEQTPKATGGYVYSDSTYWYHTFLSSGTFTPNQALTCDYLVVAGGGGGGYDTGGGGGAGGLRSTVGTTGGGGSLESALSVTAQAYSITVGAGGVGALTGARHGASGTDSTFSTITSTGGGGGGDSSAGGYSGGSGGGNRNSGSGGAGTSGQGYGGGNANHTSAGSGGGGAGAVGGNTGGTNNGGAGGNGVQITALSVPTNTGVNGYYAGGGGGGSNAVPPTIGGFGGGGQGGTPGGLNIKPGVPNTGSGGGGCGGGDSTGTANGGSGLVIIRYTK